MNKQCFRVIFSKTLQRLVVTSELAKSEGKSTEASSSSQILQKICKMRPLVFSLFCALGFVSLTENALAETLIIQADKSVPKNQQPIVLSTANGLPQINIQTPNDKGLSHNKYSQFNVTEKGAVLNNSRTGASTQLAGQVQGNPYLARGEAKVILNEVNSNKPSVMKGYVEVAGGKADVIIANPSGLHCEGCGIINSDRATFTTGKPEIKNGQVDNFKVEAGKVKVSGKDLDNSRVDYTEIIARETEANAGIWSKKETTVITGKNTVKRSDSDKKLQIISTKQPLAGEVKPQVAIDVGELGGMYSGKIHLIGTEHGVGVRNAGHIGASTDTLQIDSQGRIVNTGTLNAQKQVALTANKGIDNQGKIENKQGDIQLKSNADIQNSGSVVVRNGNLNQQAKTTIQQSGEAIAKGNINYTANNINTTTTSLIAAGVEVKDTAQGEVRTQAKRSANGKNITVKAAEKATLQGRNLAPNQLAVTAKSVNTDNSQNSAKTVKLSAEQGDLSANNAQFEAESLIFSTPKTLSTQNSYLEADLIQTTQNALNNDGGTWVQKGVEAFRLSMNGTLKNNGGTFYTPNDFYLNTGHIEHTQGRFLAGKNLTILAQNINATAGKMVVGQSLSVNAKDFINDRGFIQAAENLNITLSERFTNRQTNGENQGVFAFGKLQLNSSQLDNTQGVIFTPNAAQFTLDKWTNTQGLAQANQGLSIQTTQLNNDFGRLVSEQHLQLNVSDLFSQQQGSIGAKTLDLTAGRLQSLKGSYISSEQADIQIKGKAENRESAIDTVQNLNFTSSGLDNTQGEIRSQQAELHLDTQKQRLDNSKGSLRAATGITIQSGTLINNRGAIQTESDIQIDTHKQTLSNRQTLSKDTGIVALGNLSLNVGDVDNTQGYLATQQHLSLTGKRITNDSGLLKAGDSLSLSATNLQNHQGLVHSKNQVDLTLQQSLTQQGGEINTARLNLSTADMMSEKGSLISAVEMAIHLSGNLSNQQSRIQSQKQLTIQSGQVNNQAGVITSQESDIELNTHQQFLHNQQGEISARHHLMIQTGQTDNTAGLLYAGKDLHLNSHSQLVLNRDTAQVSGGMIAEQHLVLDTGNLDNTQGVVQAQRISASTANVTNQNGLFKAEQDFSLNATHLTNNAGLLHSNATFSLNLSGDLNQRNGQIGAEHFVLSAQNLVSQSQSLIKANQARLNLQDKLVNQESEISTTKDLTIQAGSIANNKALLLTEQGNLHLTSKHELNNQQGQIVANGTAHIESDSLDNSNGLIQAERDLTLNSHTSKISNRHGSLLSRQNITMQSGALDNQNGVIQAENLALNTQGQQLDNRQGILVANEQLSLNTGKWLNHEGVVSAKNLTVESRELAQQNGVIQGIAQAVLNIAGNANSSQNSQILGGTLSLTAQGHFDNQQSEIRALSGDLRSESKGLTNTQGVIASDKGNVSLNTQQQRLNNEQGTISGGTTLTVSSGDIDNRLGLMRSQAEMTIDTHQGSLDNRNTQSEPQQGLLALGEMRLTTQSLQNQNGKIITNLAQTIQAQNLNNQQGKITALDSQKLSIIERLDNRAGQIAVSGKSHIQAAQLDNQKGEIQADSLHLTAALNNQQGRIMSKSDQDLQLREVNNEQGLIKSILGSVQLATNSTLNNNAGEILAKNSANLTAYNIDNHDGLIYAETDRLKLNVSSAVNNQNGTLHTLNQLLLDSSRLDNQQGSIFAGNLARITSETIENQGNITSNGELTLNSQTLNNSQGNIRSQGNLTLTANTSLNNQAGLLESGKLLQISTYSLNNQNTKSDEKAPTSGIIGSSLVVNSEKLNNTQGGIYSQKNGKLNVSHLDNTQGEIRSQGDLLIRGDKLTINNQNGYLQANQKLSLTADRLSNDGNVTADDLQIRLKQDFSTGNNIHANSHLHLETQGKLTNNHQLYADQSVTLVAQDFTNQQNGRVSSENTTINVTNTVNNLGLINAITSTGEIANTVIRASQIINKNRIYGDHVALQADRIINQDDATSAPVIAARERLDLAAREIENNADHYQGDGQVGSLLFSGGDIVFGRELDENNQAVGESDTLRNISSTIEAEGDIALNVKQVENINKHYDAIHLISNQTGTDETLVNMTTLNEGYIINAQGNDRGLDDSKYFKKDRNTQTSSISTHSGLTPLSEVEWVPYSRAGRYQWRADRVEPTLIEKDTAITEDMLLAGFHDTLCENGKCQAVQAGLYPKDSPIWAYFDIPAPKTDSPAIPTVERPDHWFTESNDPNVADSYHPPIKPIEPIAPNEADYLVKDSTGKNVLDKTAYDAAVARYTLLLEEYETQLKEYHDYEQSFKPYDDWLEANQESITKLEEKIENHNKQWAEKHSHTPRYYYWFWKIQLNELREDESKLKSSAPAQILSGGNIVGNSQRITNDKSNIIAGGTLALKDKVTNIDDENGLHRLTFNGTSQFSRSRWRGGFKRYFQRDWHGIIDYERVIETPFNMGVYRMDEYTQSSQQYKPDDISTYKTDTQSKTDYQLNGSHFAQGNAYQLGDLDDVKGISHRLDSGSLFNVNQHNLNAFSAENINAEKANALLSDAAKTHTGIDTNLNPITPKTGSTNARHLEHFSLNSQQEVRTITPNLQLPNNRIYRLNSTPNSTVLVETDPDFTHEKRWLSSDYMFNALRVEPNQAQKRLGDGFYEQRLVREQINRLTGRQFLGNYTDFDSQYRALMNAGVTFAEKFNLRVGIALSPEQVANLTADIVWLETESVTLPNGNIEQVLVPKVYAVTQKGDITGKGALLSGKQVSHSGGELINSGTIAGRELIQLNSQNVKNSGTISASVLSGNVTGDLENLGGTLEADRAILLNVTGNITHGSTLHTTEVNNNGYQRSETTVGRKGLIHVKGEDGVLQLKSGGDFTVSGADIINDGQGQTYLSANGSFALNALQTGFDEKMGSGDHYRNQAIQDIEVSRIAGNGNVTLKGGSIYSEGADLDAKARLALIAENDIVLGTATRQTAYEEYHKMKSGSAVAKKTETRHANSESKTQIGTVLSADNIVLSAGHDVTVTASQVVADNDVVIATGNDVSITAGTNHFKDIYKETKKTSGAFTSGGGITFGSKSEKHEFETEGWTQSDARSAVGSLSGNVSIVAGNHAHVIGTDLIAPQEKTIAITGKTLKVEAGQDIIESNEKHEFKQSGLTVGVSSSLVDTAMAVSNGVKQAKQSKNDKLSALYAMKSAQDLIHSSETVSNTIDTVGNLVNGSITPAADDNAAVNSEPSIKVSVSVGASKSQSSSYTREVTHSASELNAGNIKLTTTAGNLDVIGSHLNADKIALSSAKDINLESSQDSYQNRSDNSNSGWSVGVFLGMSGNSMGLGVEGSAQFGKGKSNTDTITQSNTYLNAKEVSIESQNDTNLKGAVVNADTLNAEIGGNLTIESRQDTNQYHSEQTQAGVSASVAIYGSGSSASASYSQNKAKANSAQVEEQSGFNVGNGGMNVTVVGNTHLKGGRIASEAETENNYFRTGTLTTENIHNHSEMEIKNTSAGVSTNMAQMGMQAVGTALSALGNVDESRTSTTHSAIGNNIQLEVKDGNVPTELSRDVANSNEKVTAYTQADIAKYNENQEIANLAGQVGARFVGDLSEKLNWKDGSPQKVILHGVVGLISAELSGGNNVAGAAAGVTSEYLNTKVADYLSEKVKNGELTNEERNAIQQATAAGMGAMVGSLIGGNSQTAAQAGTAALNAEKFNRQLHPDEIQWIRENAEKFAEEQGISVEDAEKRLILQATQEVDFAWSKMIDTQDSAASNFLKTSSGFMNDVPFGSPVTFTNANGQQQQLFTASKEERYSMGLYADKAKEYDQANNGILSNTLQPNIKNNLVVKAGTDTIYQFGTAGAYALDNPDKVVKSITLGSSECIKNPADCLSDFANKQWSSFDSASGDLLRKHYNQEDVNYLYGKDMSSEVNAISLARIGSVVVETLPVGKLNKVGIDVPYNSHLGDFSRKVSSDVNSNSSLSVVGETLGYKTIHIDFNKSLIKGSNENHLVNNLEANRNYELSNGTKFKTNDYGYVEEISYFPIDMKMPRDKRQTQVGKEGLSTDVGGHIQACSQGGTCDRYNLFPQDANFNNSAYKVYFENVIAKAIREGKTVNVNTRFIRQDPSSSRPDRLEINYSIDGIEQKLLKFNNEAHKND